MRQVAKYAQTVNRIDEKTGQTWEEAKCYELLECPACSEVELRRYHWDEFMEPCDVRFLTLYPSALQVPIGLPSEIQQEYVAALKVRKFSPNAYAILMGRVLDMVCEDRNAKGNFLGNKLADLAARNEIPTKLVSVANSLKDLRNFGAHANLGTLTTNEIPILEELAKAILEYVYSAPHLADQAEKALQRLKQRHLKPPKK
jgi:hypothetical protein